MAPGLIGRTTREAITMDVRRTNRFAIAAVVALFGCAVSLPRAFAAEDSRGTAFPPPTQTDQKKGDKKKTQQGKKQKQSEQDLRDGYLRARAMIMDGQYEAGIAAMHALGHDDNPEIANYIGYASRKLGRYEDSKIWYEKALAADPNHVRTWSYYGMWHAEQGNKLKAEDFLEKVRLICGNTTCEEYTKLKGVIEGTQTY
jgi:tetratricopeptide (TPR) repeat protein